MAETLTKTRSTTEIEIVKPSKYKVIVFNDDKTPVDFVIAMLIKIFYHSPTSAENITLKIHNEGSASAGIYTYEVSEQKAKKQRQQEPRSRAMGGPNAP